MPVSIKSMWGIGIAGLLFILSSMTFAEAPDEIEEVYHKSGSIERIGCSEGARVFMKSNLDIIASSGFVLEFSMKGDCPELVSKLSNYDQFKAYQVRVPFMGTEEDFVPYARWDRDFEF